MAFDLIIPGKESTQQARADAQSSEYVGLLGYELLNATNASLSRSSSDVVFAKVEPDDIIEIT